MQLRELLKDIFTDLKNSCIKCGIDKIQKTCQTENPSLINELVMESYGLYLNGIEPHKLEGYST